MLVDDAVVERVETLRWLAAGRPVPDVPDDYDSAPAERSIKLMTWSVSSTQVNITEISKPSTTTSAPWTCSDRREHP